MKLFNISGEKISKSKKEKKKILNKRITKEPLFLNLSCDIPISP